MKNLKDIVAYIFENTPCYQGQPLENQIRIAQKIKDELLLQALKYLYPDVPPSELPNIPEEVICMWLNMFSDQFENTQKSLITFFKITDKLNQKYILTEKIRFGSETGKSVLWYLCEEAILNKKGDFLLNLYIQLGCEAFENLDLTAYGEFNGRLHTTADLLKIIYQDKLLPNIPLLVELDRPETFLPVYNNQSAFNPLPVLADVPKITQPKRITGFSS